MNYDPLVDLYEQQYLDYRDDLHFYLRLVDRLGGPVLELGAGTGRLTVPIARRGVEIVGLELSEKMLEKGQAKLGADLPQAQMVQGDMRTFSLNRQFGLILIPFNALMHLYTLSDQQKALENIARHLLPGGSLVFDVYVPKFGLQGVLRHEGETFYTPDGSRTDVFVLQNIDPIKQVAHTSYFVDTTDASGVLIRNHHSLTQRYFTRFELEWMLLASGFQVKHLWGSFQMEPYTEKSAHMVVESQFRHA